MKRIKIALQKSGRLSESSLELLKSCGINITISKDKLIAQSSNMDIDLLFMRDDDIAGLTINGLVDLGIVGFNVLKEQQIRRDQLGQTSQCKILKKLGYGKCRLSVARKKNSEIKSLEDLRGKRIATSYPNIVNQHFKNQGISFQTTELSGSVEIAPRVGLADAIVDLVSTGATLKANGLEELEAIVESEAVLIQRPGYIEPQQEELITRILARISGVSQAKASKYIMLHAPKEAVQQITSLLPGAEKPTIIPLDGCEKTFAVHAVSKETLFWETIEKLKQLGASSILVLPIEKMMN